MHWANLLRQELSVRNREIATATGSLHALTPGEIPSVIFGRNECGAHANFHPVSYRNIHFNPPMVPAPFQGSHLGSENLIGIRLAMDGTRLRE